MALIKPSAKKVGIKKEFVAKKAGGARISAGNKRSAGGCKWCALGECWGCKESGQSNKGKGGGRRQVVTRTIVKKQAKGGGRFKGAGKASRQREQAKGGCKWCAIGECRGCKESGQSNKGKGKGRGGKKQGGNSGGQWMFVPKGRSKGAGKSSDPKKAQFKKSMDKLQKIEADKKVWIGGLPKTVTWKTLEKHIEESCGTKPGLTEIMSKGTGCCAFKTAEDAQTAIATVNGTELSGSVIEVDVWTEKEKKEGDRKPKRKFGAAFVKKGPATKSKSSQVDPSLKVWVGGLDEKTSGGKLKKHFVDNGAAADFADIMKKGTACVTFTDESSAADAVGIMSGTELDGKTIEVDVWTKPEKKLKAEKKAEE